MPSPHLNREDTVCWRSILRLYDVMQILSYSIDTQIGFVYNPPINFYWNQLNTSFLDLSIYLIKPLIYETKQPRY